MLSPCKLQDNKSKLDLTEFVSIIIISDNQKNWRLLMSERENVQRLLRPWYECVFLF